MAQGRLNPARAHGRRTLAPLAALCGLGALGFFMGQGAAAMHDMQARLAQEAAQGVASRQVIIRVVGAQGTPTPTYSVTSSATSKPEHQDLGALPSGTIRPLNASGDSNKKASDHGKGPHGPKH